MARTDDPALGPEGAQEGRKVADWSIFDPSAVVLNGEPECLSKNASCVSGSFRATKNEASSENNRNACGSLTTHLRLFSMPRHLPLGHLIELLMGRKSSFY